MIGEEILTLQPGRLDDQQGEAGILLGTEFEFDSYVALEADGTPEVDPGLRVNLVGGLDEQAFRGDLFFQQFVGRHEAALLLPAVKVPRPGQRALVAQVPVGARGLVDGRLRRDGEKFPEFGLDRGVFWGDRAGVAGGDLFRRQLGIINGEISEGHGGVPEVKLGARCLGLEGVERGGSEDAVDIDLQTAARHAPRANHSRLQHQAAPH